MSSTGPGRQGPNRMLDEFARMMTDAAGAAQGVRREMETMFRAQGERLMNQMDIVQREEFEAVRDMAAKARTENETLKRRLADLEAKIANLPGAASGSETTQSQG
ncbi:MAG: accessory factor UbiK family protein [Aurantimonas endophytica]|uniref:Accessory factor UbiK family protein n=2 Tax=Aurantimonas TaxID=182269 RepID=A0A6L9MCT8_9HYPH|nr:MULTISPECIES: accessory factor UbiK family protein [Aurantimonas]MBB4002389.1 BMFP domain-containing protein YqiC [Aurantimonas endophytica]MCO6401990.1 accessory factor UbiK family protein [Aurantimonas endophytica]NDV85633.1 accessory factor UbiK family protein [Aurantimonas aggregata]